MPYSFRNNFNTKNTGFETLFLKSDIYFLEKTTVVAEALDNYICATTYEEKGNIEDSRFTTQHYSILHWILENMFHSRSI